MTIPEHPSAGQPQGLPLTLEQLLALQPQQPADASRPATASAQVQSLSESQNLPRLLAIVSEGEAGAQIQAKLQWLNQMAQILWISGYAQALEQIQMQEPQAVLLQFSATDLAEASQAVQHLQSQMPHMPVFAIGSTNEAQCMLAALRAGVQDFLGVEEPPEILQANLHKLLQRSTPAHTLPEEHEPASLTVLMGARAGLGTSLLATHLALQLQEQLSIGDATANTKTTQQAEVPLHALLLDLGTPTGDSGLYLNVQCEFDFIDAVHSLRRFDRKLASTGITAHESGLRLLSLVKSGSAMREVSYSDVDLLLQRLRSYFQHVVADLGGVGSTSLATRVALRADRLWIVCDQSLASVVSTAELLRQLRELKADSSKMGLILSRHDAQLELSAEQIATQLDLPLIGTVPERRAVLLQAINQGLLLPSQSRREPYVTALAQLRQKIPLEAERTSTGRSAGGWWSRWVRRETGGAG